MLAALIPHFLLPRAVPWARICRPYGTPYLPIRYSALRTGPEWRVLAGLIATAYWNRYPSLSSSCSVSSQSFSCWGWEQKRLDKLHSRQEA
ncbi:MAG: hypothetical protein LUD02_08915 [Tannerellaceae bacterium]|nr:hypothetical protein [Tannerellaceae bacterium]